MLNKQLYALIYNKNLKYINDTLHMFSNDKYISANELKKEVYRNKNDNIFSVSDFFLKSHKDEKLYLNSYKTIKFSYDYGIKDDYYLFSKKLYNLINENFSFAPHIARSVIIHDKQGLFSSDYIGVYFKKNLDILDLEKSKFFLEKHTNMLTPTQFYFKDEAYQYHLFELQDTFFSFTLVVCKQLKKLLDDNNFSGFEVININSLKDDHEKNTGLKLNPKNYRPKLP